MSETTQKKYRVCNFRPTPENAKRLDIAAELNLNVSQIVNETFAKAFDSVMAEKVAQLENSMKRMRETPPTFTR